MISEKLIRQLLIAEPSISGDLSFNRSVILLRTDEGSVGFIINKPLKYCHKWLLTDGRCCCYDGNIICIYIIYICNI
jgi:putative transcriptional regulator